MSTHESRTQFFLKRWFIGNTLLAGFFALLWLLLRSGTRPSRLAYPCQQAAVTTASLAFGAPLVGALIAARCLAGRLICDRRILATAAVGLFVTIGLWGFLSRSTASSTYGLLPPAGYRAEVFHVTDCPPDPVGDRFPGLDSLLRLMGENDRKFYLSATVSPLSGPDGIIASDDVVVVKINYQWGARGGTNTDLLRGLIRALVDHPDGFTGEIVVGENTQFAPSANFDRSGNNAQDQTLSPRDVVVGFQNQGFRVSLSDWRAARTLERDEGVPCDQGWGYVILATEAGRVSYPKFPTGYGTCVSLKHGVWNPDAGDWDRSRLKLINMPVLKPHWIYAVTACVKNYMGVVTDSLGTNSHDGVGGGLMGAVMAEIDPPDLNILDCIWTCGHPGLGPDVGYGPLSRSDQLVASTDPIAADIWATTNILIPSFLANGHSPPWPNPNPDPEDPNSRFRAYLDRSMEWMLDGGFAVTNDLDSIDVYSSSAAIRRPEPRRPSGRVMPRTPDSEQVLQR
jgi:uncharacterized protein (DUF362 family)